MNAAAQPRPDSRVARGGPPSSSHSKPCPGTQDLHWGAHLPNMPSVRVIRADRIARPVLSTPDPWMGRGGVMTAAAPGAGLVSRGGSAVRGRRDNPYNLMQDPTSHAWKLQAEHGFSPVLHALYAACTRVCSLEQQEAAGRAGRDPVSRWGPEHRIPSPTPPPYPGRPCQKTLNQEAQAFQRTTAADDSRRFHLFNLTCRQKSAC